MDRQRDRRFDRESYYVDDRGFVPTYQRWFTQVGTDTISQVLKEFWPDVKHKFLHKSDGNIPVSSGAQAPRNKVIPATTRGPRFHAFRRRSLP